MKEANLDILGQENPFELIGRQWMLITAGTAGSYNTMTASWGGLGYLWNRPVAFIFVRPERFTHDFLEAQDKVTLSFYPESCRGALQICGSKSGRDCDKAALAGLSPVILDGGAVTFAQARLTVDGHVLYKCGMDECGFADKSVLKWYGEGEGGFHTLYVVGIDRLWQND